MNAHPHTLRNVSAHKGMGVCPAFCGICRKNGARQIGVYQSQNDHFPSVL